MWAGFLRSPPLGSIPRYGSPRFSSSKMDLVSDDAVECLEDRCSSLGPKTDQRRARLEAVQMSQCRSQRQCRRFKRSVVVKFQHSLYYVEHS